MIPLPLPPKIIHKKDNAALFEIEGLYPGYGVTIGNALRRVLLSSLGGAAITQVKIKGVSHEFSTIQGIFEDVVIILMNLKRLNFCSFSDEPQAINLKVKGETTVKGKDFKLTSEVQLTNPESHIATLTKSSAELEIEALIEKGVGYEPVERREIIKSEVGVIPLDAIYTPIKKVSFSVENMRVGKRTDFDRLKIEIETNGVITPEEAMKKSLNILVDHFSLILETFAELQQDKVPAKDKKLSESKSAKAAKGEDGIKKTKIEELKISERIKSVLLKNNIKTVGGLLKKSEANLLELEGLGEKAVEELKKTLKKLEVELKK